jgi:hypothetical protein
MGPDPSVALPTTVVDLDGLDISPSPATVSGTLSLGPGTTNLNTPSGSTTFFLQGDTANPMATDEEQTTTPTPLGDDLSAFNTAEATFHRLCAVHSEPLSLRLTASPVNIHVMVIGLL